MFYWAFLIHLYSYYREAELRGATLILMLTMRVEDAESQVKLSRHLADETRHVWLWTKRITDLGYEPVHIDDGYQTRIGKAVGIPRSLVNLYALTVVVEERAQRRYLEHSRRSDVDAETLAILQEVTKDEKWHVGWIKGELKALAGAKGGEGKRPCLRAVVLRVPRFGFRFSLKDSLYLAQTSQQFHHKGFHLLESISITPSHRIY